MNLNYYVPFQHTDFDKNLDLKDSLELLKDCFESDTIKKTGQNLKYDCHILLNYGLKVSGIIDDSLLQSYIIDSTQKHNLDSLAAKYLNIETVKYDEITGKGSKKYLLLMSILKLPRITLMKMLMLHTNLLTTLIKY